MEHLAARGLCVSYLELNISETPDGGSLWENMQPVFQTLRLQLPRDQRTIKVETNLPGPDYNSLRGTCVRRTASMQRRKSKV